MAVLVQTLIDQIRLLSNLKNNQFYSDDDIGGFVNDAAMELDDIFTDAAEHYSSSSYDFTLAGAASTVLLPTDFMKEQILLRDPTASSPTQVPMLANLAERGRIGDGNMTPGLGRCFYVGGDLLEILPASSAAGDYRLLYTPQLGNVWASPPDFTVRLAGALAGTISSALSGGAKGPGATLTGSANGALSMDGSAVAFGDRVLVLNTGLGSAVVLGIYTVSQPGAGGNPFILARATDWDESRELHVGSSILATAGAANIGVTFRLTAFQGAVDVAPQTFATTVVAPPTLPVRLVPWQLFIKAHVCVTIVQGRKQPSGEFVQKLESQRARARAMSKNRSEGVTQAPITRGGRGYFAGEPDSW